VPKPPGITPRPFDALLESQRAPEPRAFEGIERPHHAPDHLRGDGEDTLRRSHLDVDAPTRTEWPRHLDQRAAAADLDQGGGASRSKCDAHLQMRWDRKAWFRAAVDENVLHWGSLLVSGASGW